MEAPLAASIQPTPTSTATVNQTSPKNHNSPSKPRRQRAISQQNPPASPNRSHVFYNSRAHSESNSVSRTDCVAQTSNVATDNTASEQNRHQTEETRSNNQRRRPQHKYQPQNNDDNKKKVLVTGFPSYTQQAEISRVLTQFGNLTIEKCKNRLAVVEFASEEEAANALRANNQLVIYGEFLNIQKYTNSKHVEDLIKADNTASEQNRHQTEETRPNNQRRRPQHKYQPKNNEDNKKKVLVTGFPSYTEQAEISRVLTQFGNLTIEKCKNRLAVVEFASEEEAANALKANNQLVIYGEFLNIKKYTNSKHVEDLIKANRRIINQEKDDLISPKDLDLTGDFYEQVENIQNAIRLTREEVTAIGGLYSELEAVLQQIYPGCVAVPFGSITTGLGVKSSDADCFVQLPPRFLVAGYDVSFVHKCRRLLATHDRFAELVAIPRANTPILKFLHRPTLTRCDLSCKTPLGTINSRLMAYLLRRDPRFQPTALLLKYWARVQRLSGSGRLTNYALVLLLVFYLQVGPRLLPSIVRLQAASPAPHLVDDWDASFVAEPPPPPPPQPALPDLLGGFFRFYADFDFEKLVVCPFLGEPVPKTAFENESAPPAFGRYLTAIRSRRAGPLRHTSAICVQDPFEHSHNVAAGVSPRLAAQLLEHIRSAARAYEVARPSCATLLPAILAHAERPAHILRIHVPRRILTRLAPNSWRDEVRSLLLDVVFTRLLNLRPEPDDVSERQDSESEPPPEEGSDSGGAEGESGTESEGKETRERYRMWAAVATWTRRKFANPRAYSAAALEMREKALTARLAVARDLRPPEPFLLRLEFAYKEQPRALTVTVELAKGSPEWFPSLAKFLHIVEQSWLPILTRPDDIPPDSV